MLPINIWCLAYPLGKFINTDTNTERIDNREVIETHHGMTHEFPRNPCKYLIELSDLERDQI